jgi:chloramphenicol 3-O phosphotransferase
MPNGKIIFLNGASSSGKTSILHELQNLLEEPFLNAGIDKFIWMLPKRYLDRPLWDDVLGLADHAGQAGHTLFLGMHRAIHALAQAGNNILADHVLVEEVWLRDCAELFTGLSAYLIGLRCPLDVLENRERQRKDRTLGQARLQHDLVHAHGLYDLEVDTARYDPRECALQIQAWIKAGNAPSAFTHLKARYALLPASIRD